MVSYPVQNVKSFFGGGRPRANGPGPHAAPAPGKKTAGALAGSGRRLSKKVKNPLPAADIRRRWQHIQGNFAANCVGGHRPIARFAVKFCRRLWSRAPPAADAARRSRGGGRRAQAPLQGAQRDAGTATRNPKGETGASGSAVRDCCPFWSLSSFSTSSTAGALAGSGRYCLLRDHRISIWVGFFSGCGLAWALGRLSSRTPSSKRAFTSSGLSSSPT